MFSPWRKATQVRGLVLEHVAQVRTTMEIFFESLRVHLEGGDTEKAEALSLEAHRAESAADDIRRRVEQKLVGGALLAPSRRQILEIIEQVDRLANSAEATLDYLFVQRVEIPEAIVPFLLRIAEESADVFHEVECGLQALFDGKRSESDACMVRIDHCESRVDEIERQAVKTLFRMDLELARKLHVYGLIESLVEISDRAEDLADRITLVTAEREF